MRRTRGNTQMQENHENAFNLSISDLMAGMLSVFILAVCYFMLNLGQVKDQYMGNNAKRDQLLEEIQEEMSERGISVKIDKKEGVLRIPEGALFAQGEADVKEEGQQVIRNLGDVLYQLLDKKEYKNVVETVLSKGIRTMWIFIRMNFHRIGSCLRREPSIHGIWCVGMCRSWIEKRMPMSSRYSLAPAMQIPGPSWMMNMMRTQKKAGRRTGVLICDLQ